MFRGKKTVANAGKTGHLNKTGKRKLLLIFTSFLFLFTLVESE